MQNWTSVRGFSNPPWCLIHHCLTKLKKQTAQMVLITPLWKTQPWYPILLELLEEDTSPTRSRGNASGARIFNATRSVTTSCLRQSYSSGGFSPQASDLILASGPIEDVVNFLAGLFKDGYQYQSLCISLSDVINS